jgi:hypothetical protein
MGNFAKNLSNLIMGGANSQISGAEKKFLKDLALTLTLLNCLGGVDSILSCIFGSVPCYINPLTALGCWIGCNNKAHWKLRDDAPAETIPTVYAPRISVGGVGCFGEGTPVVLAYGVKESIEQIKIGGREKNRASVQTDVSMGISLFPRVRWNIKRIVLVACHHGPNNELRSQ